MEKDKEHPLAPLPRAPKASPADDKSVSEAEQKSQQQRSQGKETQGIP